jgi:hypothetical protein
MLMDDRSADLAGLAASLMETGRARDDLACHDVDLP